MKNKRVVKKEVGSHLTVTTYSDGSTNLDWCDTALLRDVSAATGSPEPVINFDSMSKRELEQLGRYKGIELDRRRKKPVLIDELEKTIAQK